MCPVKTCREHNKVPNVQAVVDWYKASAKMWKCECGEVNNGGDHCVLCHRKKPSFIYNKWVCPNCTLSNVMKSAVCELCHADRPADAELHKAQKLAKSIDERMHLAKTLRTKGKSPTQLKKEAQEEWKEANTAAMEEEKKIQTRRLPI